MADALSLCAFETYDEGKLNKGKEWYRFNVEPNKNQNQAEFWNKVLYKMVYSADGALVIKSDEGEYIVADDFEVSKYAYYNNVYSSIELPGGFKLNGTKEESEVFHFQLHNSKVLEIVNSVYDDYGKLISGTIHNYNRGNAIKLQLKIDTLFEQFKARTVVKEDGTTTTEYDMIIEDLFENKFKGIFSDKDSITPIQNGLSIEEIKNSPGNTKSGAVNSRDITDTFDDIVDMTADAFGIPRGIVRGDVADNEGLMKMFTNFPVKAMVDNLQSEINRKLYKEPNILKGTKLKIQTNTILPNDIVSLASSAEALFRIGVYNADEIRVKYLNEEPLNTEQSQRYAVTKNYQMETENETGEETTSGR